MKYLGSAGNIEDKHVLLAAGSILTVEARHQTILNVMAGSGTAIPGAFDLALTPPEVLAIAGPFVSGCDLGIKGKRNSRYLFVMAKLTHLIQPIPHSRSPIPELPRPALS